MHRDALLLTILMALAGVSGLTLPNLFKKDNCPEKQPQYQQVKGNQSTAFGWQLVGAAKDRDGLDTICSGIGDGEYSKWAEEGLDLVQIKEPICKSSSSPNATLALPNIVFANSKVFTTLLLSSFQPSTDWSNYLCDNLRYDSLDGFLLNSDMIINTICTKAKQAPSPEPFVSVATIDHDAIDDFQTASARLFAYMVASSATSDTSLKLACAHAATNLDAWNKMRLNATAVQETLCAIDGVLTVAQGKSSLTEWTSRAFAAVLPNISNAAGYRDFLCRSLSAEGMQNVGLDDKLVCSQICGA